MQNGLPAPGRARGACFFNELPAGLVNASHRLFFIIKDTWSLLSILPQKAISHKVTEKERGNAPIVNNLSQTKPKKHDKIEIGRRL
jgi:hypothetical protein